jgi:glutathione S-transferase
LILFDSRNSGNGWKVRMLLSELEAPFERRVLDLARGDARSEAFLGLNPWARVPVLALQDGSVLRESNAILLHLAAGSPLLPESGRQQILEWLFFEQCDHMRYLARPRYLLSLAKTALSSDPEIVWLQAVGNRTLAAMDGHLRSHAFLAGDYSVADIALFPYTQMAEMGGYQLERYPSVVAWLSRIQRRPRYVPL